ncbi:MAG: hypothetical protein K1Y36_03985 [Blastocatellia bacterium]|nr:hypothetical protein [Blastocatellia bacterium]
MNRKFRALVLIALCCVPFLGMPLPTRACGPDFDEAVFTYTKHPDFPLEVYAKGNLGVLQSSYAWSYLIVAYRYLNDIGLEPAEQTAAVNVWNTKLGTGPAPATPPEDPEAEWTKEWFAARATVPNLNQPPKPAIYRRGAEEYVTILNITPEAFHVAALTLTERIKKYSAASPVVRDWVAAQDQVFSNDGKTLAVPAAATGADKLVAADRNYQIAAAYFYAAQFDEAAKRFEAIASDSASPWKSLAPYLVARCHYRKTSEPKVTEEQKITFLEQCEKQCEKVLAAKPVNEYSEAAARLLRRARVDLVDLKLAKSEESIRNAEKRKLFDGAISATAKGLLRKNSGEGFGKNLWDFSSLLDQEIDLWETVSYNIVNRKFAQLPPVRLQDDVTDWVLVFQTRDTDARDYAIAKWEKGRQLPWLMAALAKVDGKHPKTQSLLAEAAKIQPASPAFEMTVYHQIRLTLESGKNAEVRAMLDNFLKTQGAGLRPSARNQFIGLQLQTAKNVSELLKFALRKPVTTTNASDYNQLPLDVPNAGYYSEDPNFAKTRLELLQKPLLDSDATRLLNQGLPLSLLKDAAQDKTLPNEIRKRVAIAVWVKAALLNNHVIGRLVAPTVEALEPELKEHTQAYLTADTDAKATFAMIFAILRSPGLRPYVDDGFPRETALGKMDEFRNNWWCRFDDPVELTIDPFEKQYLMQYDEQGNPKPRPKFEAAAFYFPPAFLTQEQKAAGLKEWQQLTTIPTAPNFLCRQVVDWVKQNPTDPRNAEALHLAVRATRYGCTDDTTTKFSKEAFQVLKKQYPQTEWAKKTKYYF